MTRRPSIMFAGSSLLVLASAAAAQPVTSSNAATQAEQANRATGETGTPGGEDIIVTARRRAENIQNVPQSIEAVTGEDLRKFNLLNFEDLGKVVSGLTLSRSGNTTATIRGVSFTPTSQTTPTVAFYLNDVPVQPNTVFLAYFDVGQFEVLRGPQGTLRGLSAPSGSITITTRRPVFNEWGGTAAVTVTNQDTRNVQAALNVPLIDDMLALRVAGVIDHNNFGGVRSVNSSTKPYSETKGVRATLRFEPSNNLSAVLMYQHLDTEMLGFGPTSAYSAIFGAGAPGGLGAASAEYAQRFVQPVGYNGPSIAMGQRLTVAENPSFDRSPKNFISAQVDYRILGQKISYVGARSIIRSIPGTRFGDDFNMVPGGDWLTGATTSRGQRDTHELRIGSDERLFGLLDYVIGAFHSKESIANDVITGRSFLGGAFGTPLGAPQLISANPRFMVTNRAFFSPNYTKETSFFGNLTLHLGEKTEISGGVRFIDAEKVSLRTNSTSAAFRAVSRLTAAGQPANNNTALPLLNATTCAAARGLWQATYTGVCDIPIAANVTGVVNSGFHQKPTIWSGSASHRFTDNLLIYANAGSAFRPGPPQGSIINGRNDPTLLQYTLLGNETSKSYEVGVKASLLDRKLRVNLAVFHQDFKNLVTILAGQVPYLRDDTITQSITLLNNLSVNADAKVNGLDFDFDFDVTPSFTVSGAASYAKGRYGPQQLPCWDQNFDGVPDKAPLVAPTVADFTSRGKFIAICSRSGSISLVPEWTGNLRAEYRRPVSGDVDAFVSGIFNYSPRNRNASTTYVVPSYALINLNVGARDNRAGWEIQAFVKNLTVNKTVTAIGATDPTATAAPANLFGLSGYRTISYLEPREFGLTFRYAFGSR